MKPMVNPWFILKVFVLFCRRHTPNKFSKFTELRTADICLSVINKI